ncbi:MAG: outer membrane beta-barrel domain-containing protein [Myxococcota bacterium]
MKRLLLAAMLLAPSGSAWAGIEEQLRSGEIIAVDERPYRMIHEFSVSGGVIPTDAYYLGISLGGAYTLHLSDIWAWEAFNFQYSANVSTDLESELLEAFEVTPERDPRLQYLLTSSLVVTPLFGKQAVLNKGIVFQGVHFALGGGVANFAGDDADDAFLPQLSFGPGLRFFLGQAVSTRLDLRGIAAFDAVADSLEVEFLFHSYLSFSFNFGKKRATELGDEELVDESTGYEKLDELYPGSDPSVVVLREGAEDDDED